MADDLDVAVADVFLTSNIEGTMVAIEAQIVDLSPTAPPRRSGKSIRLSMTPRQAMRLLAQLQAAQAQFSYPSEPTASPTTVPPAKARN
jgi:hypothetical protein